MTNSKLTLLGKLFIKKSINKASISRRTGITKQRLTKLSRDAKIKILANEVYLIGLTVGVDPGRLLDMLCRHLKDELKEDIRVDGRKKKGKKRGK